MRIVTVIGNRPQFVKAAAVSPLYVALALALSVTIGLVAGVLPARAAARLEPLDALRAE